jgi:hypothetical protein
MGRRREGRLARRSWTTERADSIGLLRRSLADAEVPKHLLGKGVVEVVGHVELTGGKAERSENARSLGSRCGFNARWSGVPDDHRDSILDTLRPAVIHRDQEALFRDAG